LAPWVCGCGVELACEGEAVVLLLVHMWKSITLPWLVARESSEATWEVGRTFYSREKTKAFEKGKMKRYLLNSISKYGIGRTK